MKDIIQKYWNGETSLEEERRLREWLMDAPQTPENKRLSTLMQWYSQEQKEQMNPPLEASQFMQAHTKEGRIKSFRMWAAGIAAAIVLLFSLQYFFSGPTQAPKPQNIAFVDTYEDPDEAYKAAEEALLLLSTKMNATKRHKKKLRKIHILSDLVESYTKK